MYIYITEKRERESARSELQRKRERKDLSLDLNGFLLFTLNFSSFPKGDCAMHDDE